MTEQIYFEHACDVLSNRGVCFHTTCQHPERNMQCYESPKPPIKTTKIKISDYKDTSLSEIAHSLFFDKFKKSNPTLDEDQLNDKFYTEITNKLFQHGEYLNLELTVDENLNIISGKIIPFIHNTCDIYINMSNCDSFRFRGFSACDPCMHKQK